VLDRDVVEPTPRHQEGLMGDVVCDVRPGASADETHDVSVGRLVEVAEPTRTERVV
jgi:hypothetical protein